MIWGPTAPLPTYIVPVSPKTVANPQAFLTQLLPFETEKVTENSTCRFMENSNK
jgi:hypothetical protein